ncbi:MAG TPA: DegV family protein [bacterium]|nr:DegV family protein [bacterium]HQG44508.1 DegV family protein [bacterium]HQI48072.1 DegV family protein [bacterium]HQJ63310.1 DegV family protein [bacterium]
MQIKIRYIDGGRLRRAIIGSAGRIIEMQEKLNNINVFPVADADTGTNMALTMKSIVASAQSCAESSLTQVCRCIAEGAMTGARGNSGAILAQFFQGLAEGAHGRERLAPAEFAQAVALAAIRAQEALANPREGTILTVMQDWSEFLKAQAIGEEDFTRLLQKGLTRAKESLADTPNKLQALRKAGVVDAGAQGFVHLLEGLSDFIDSGKVAALRAGSHVAEKIRHFHFRKTDEEIHFRYCTECLIQGEELDRARIQEQLMPLGDSLIVVGGAHKVRIHIHVNDPQAVFDRVAAFGTLLQTKAEDMKKQNEEAVNLAPRRGIALVTDSSCDLPPAWVEKYHIHLVPVLIHIGEESYRDRDEISSRDFYKHLESGKVRLRTSQPPVASFINLYKKLAEQYESILSIHLSEALSGTIQGARLAARELAAEVPIAVVNSRTTSAGLGLVVHEAARMIESGLSLAELKERIEEVALRVRFFVAIPTLKYLVRSGRVRKSQGFLGTLLHIKPLISLNSEGRVVEVAKVIGRKRIAEKTVELTLAYARRVLNPRFIVVHMLAQNLGESMRHAIEQEFAGIEIPVLDASPALGLHAGVGAAAIAVLGDPLPE